jgi:predicted transcriptional regulator
MALVDDLVTLSLLVSAAFFVALSLGLMVRYRRISQRMSESSDLGHDLWQALEQRMRKQDERILDMMGRLEVVQSRVMAVANPPSLAPPLPPSMPAKAPPIQVQRDVAEPTPAMQQPARQAERPESQREETSQGPSQPLPRRADPDLLLDETQLAALKLLRESSKNTRQLTNALERSREHTARVMKELFELGLVRRNDSTKPFVYQLTDDGRRFASGGISDSPPSAGSPPSP